MDAFDVLGLEPAVELDAKLLEQRYRDLQRQLHPDKFVHASSSERRESLSRAVSVNEAYRALRDPLKRAELVLTRLVGPVPKEGEPSAEPALLMEIMELREELAGLRKSRDLPRALALREQVRAREQDARAALERALSLLRSVREGPAVEAARRALSRLRYYQRFHDEVDSFEDELAD